MDILTPHDIAARVGCVADTVPRIARKHGIGTPVGRQWFFTRADAERLVKLIQPRRGRPVGRKNNAKTRKK